MIIKNNDSSICTTVAIPIHSPDNAKSGPSAASLAAYCLQLSGKQLHLSALLAVKKFRGWENKGEALAAFPELEAQGLASSQSRKVAGEHLQ